VNIHKSIVTIMMHVQQILAMLKAQTTILANMKRLFVTIMMPALTTHAALLLDVFTLIIATNVFLRINVMMLNVTKNKDA